MTSPSPKPTAYAAAINDLNLRLGAAEALFGANSQTATNLREELRVVRLSAEQAQNTAVKARTTATLALKKGDQTRRLLEALGSRVAEDHDSIVTILGRLENLQAAGGSASSFAALVAAGFNADQRQAIMLMAQTDDASDDKFVAELILGLRQELIGLTDVVATHSTEIVGLRDGLTGVTGRTTHLETAFGELKGEVVEVRALASANASVTRGDPNWGLGVVVGIISAIVVGLVFRHWVDASTTVCWVATGFGFVLGLLAGASFESPGDMATSASAKAGILTRRRTPTPPAEPAPPALPAGSSPTTTPVPVTAAAASAGAAT